MSSVLHDLEKKLSSSKSAPNHPADEPQQGQASSEEQTFNILPHPAVSYISADSSIAFLTPASEIQ
jgi:hypothetical protein